MIRCRIGFLIPILSILGCCIAPHAACAMVGGAPPADMASARHVVLLVGSGGTSCTGVAISRDLVLTAGHCVLPGWDYKLMEFDAARNPQLRDVSTIARHPQFELASLLAHRATADVALLKLAAPLPQTFAPAPLAAADRTVAVGDAFVVTGYGLAVRGDGRSGGTLRAATLAATGQPGTLQLRLFDPRTKGETTGLGACTGDSGAPVFDPRGGRLAVIGVVSWSTGPKLGAGCGGLTGVTPLSRYRAWIIETAAKLGSELVP
jgi:Trypsin